MDIDKILLSFTPADEMIQEQIDDNKTELLSLETELDKKADKTFIESVESNKSVVTVPDGVTGFAAVGKICGKTVKSKNLIPYPYSFENGAISNGVTFTYDETGTIYLNGASSSANQPYANVYKSFHNDVLKVGKEYTISIETNGIAQTDFYIGIYTYTEPDTAVVRTISVPKGENSISFTPNVDENRFVIYLWGFKSHDYNNIWIRPMLEEGSEATEYEPYFEGLRSAPVENVAIISGDNTVIENEKFFNDSHAGADTTRCRSNALPVDVVADTVIAAVKSKSGKEIDCVLVTYKGTTKIVDTGWTANNLIYTLTDRDFDFAAINIRYHDNSNIIKDDITLSLNCGKRNQISLKDIVKNLPDYGMSAGGVYNYIDFERGVYVHNVGSIDMGTLNWKRYDEHRFNVTDFITPYNVKRPATNNDVPNTISAAPYPITSVNDVTTYCICVGNNFNCYDDTIPDDVNELKNKLDGAILNFELATPEVIDLKSFFPVISVEPNGTIEFVNEYNLDVPNKINYKKEVM